MIEHDTMPATPDSPPDLTSSKTSKTSSFHSSYHSNDSAIFEDANHFEEIGLDDNSGTDRLSDLAYGVTTLTLSPTAIGDKTYLPASATRFPIHISGSQLQKKRSKSDLQNIKTRPGHSQVHTSVRNVAPLDIHAKALGLMGPPSKKSTRNIASSGHLTLSLNYKRKTSPIPMNAPRCYPANGNARYSAPARSPSYMARRSSWQSNRERKTTEELERECDEEDGDDVPEDCFLQNVPISPRPPQERTPSNSRPSSRATSAERPPKPKSKVRSMGNGTPAADVERGSLRSPAASRSPSSSKSNPAGPNTSMGEFPSDHGANPGKLRAKSWTVAMSELSPETRELTEALESHASELESNPQPMRPKSSSSSFSTQSGFSVPRVKSSMAELPPLRRTNIMIDPLPPSKEKAAVLSRTRPSWLPPKDPEEERRHLKEYKRMMAMSVEAEKKKEAEVRQREVARDEVANSLQRIWEEFVLKDWDGAMKQKRTRELWWRGVSPRCRGTVWQKAIRNELELTESSYLAALRRAKDLDNKVKRGQATKEEERMGAWFEAIRLDTVNTYPELMIFQEAGPLHEALINVLMAYSMYRSDVGYVPGTHTIAALLLLNLPTPSSAFALLANSLNRSLPLAFHTRDPVATQTTYNLVLNNLMHKFPRLYTYLITTVPQAYNIQISELLEPIFTSMFTGYLGLDEVTRLWDVWVFEGDAVFVRAGIALLGAVEGKLYAADGRREVKAVFEGLSSRVGTGESSPFGGEDEWMIKVRDAGKC